MAVPAGLVINEMVETILTKEPDWNSYHYQPSSGLATPPTWLDKEWKVPKVGSSLSAFWSCANELEIFTDLGEAVVFVQNQVSESIGSIVTSHAEWLERNATYGRVGPTDPGSGTLITAVKTAQERLQHSTNAFWNWKFLLRGLEGPLPSYAGDLTAELAVVRDNTNTRLSTIESQLTDIRGQFSDIRDQFSELRDLIVGSQGGTPPLRPPTPSSPTPWGPVTTPKPIRVPPPKFDGTKEGTKITTWFEQFDDYSTIMQISPCDLVANASLCLSGRAAEQWALMKKSLVQRGKDPRDFDTFKAEMLAQFVEGKVEHTVRVRLARLKHSGSVASYHAAFRAIMVEAVQHPISGPEACSAFRTGLKPAVYQLVMRDPMAKDEFEHLDVVVKAAKEAEYLLSIIAGASDHATRRDDRLIPRKVEKRRLPPMAPRDAKKPSKPMSSLEAAAERTKWVKRGLPEAVWFKRHQDGRCYNCGALDHATSDCETKGPVLPPPRK